MKCQHTHHKATPLFFCWITLPANLKNLDFKKSWFGDKLAGYFCSPEKNFMLLACRILNICNYEVLYGLIYQKMVTCKCYPTLESYGT